VVDKIDGDAVGVDVVALTPMEIAAQPEPRAIASWVEADDILIP
jgi:hypothetical protein